MADPIFFDGYVADQGFGAAPGLTAPDDWEASSAMPDGPDEYLIYGNWALGPVPSSTPDGTPTLPYGGDLVLDQDSSLAVGETFGAGTVDLEGGVFTDSGSVDAMGLTVGPSSSMVLLPGGTFDLSGDLFLEQLATLQVASRLDLEYGSFNGSDAVLAEVTIGPTGLMNVGTVDGGSFTLSSTAGLTFADDDGELNVGGQLTLQTTDGNVSLVGATLRMDDSAGYGGVNLIDNADGTISVQGSSLIVGAQAATYGAALQFGESGDGTVVNLFASSITGEGSLDNAATLQGSDSRIGLQGTFLNAGVGAVTEAYDGILSFQSGGQATTIDPLSEGVFEIGSDGTLDLATNTSVGGATVMFLSNSGILAVDDSVADFSGAVSGFATGDELEIEGSTLSAATYDGAHTVQITESDGQTVDFTDLSIAGRSAGPLEVTNVGADGFVALQAACYLRGTHILTDRGEVPIECLNVGDFVVTASGQARPVRWLGHRGIDCKRYPDPSVVWPICIKAGAFADRLPLRDLWVSPGHAMLVDDVLIPAAKLVNDATILRLPRAQIEYWHVELDNHDILVAEGLPSESYLDTGNRTAFTNGGAFLDAYPDFPAKHWADTCVPLALEGPAVHRAKSALLARAQTLGHALTDDADAHVIVEGERVEAVRLGKSRLAFLLPAGSSIELRSRSFTPMHILSTSDDTRALGLCVNRVQLNGTDMALDDEAGFARGWHALENANGSQWRWSKDRVPLPADTRLIVMDIAGPGYYWVDAAMSSLSSPASSYRGIFNWPFAGKSARI